MKKIKILSAWLLALLMLMTACGQEAAETESTENETVTAQETSSTQGMTDADRAYLAKYIADFEAGKLEGETFFEYEQFSEFLAPFEYKGLTYPDDSMIDSTVSDEDVDDYLTLFSLVTLVSDDQYQALTEGTVQKFDVATIDFRGLIDGKESDNTNGSDYELLIGSGEFIDGFESGLIGAEVGKEVQLDLKFSPFYGATDVAGKDVTFFVTVKKIQRPAIPELGTETVNEYFKTEFTTMEEAKAWFKEALQTKAANETYSYLSAYLQERLLEKIQVVQYPEREMKHFSSLYMSQHEAAKGDDDWGVYCSEKLGMSYEELLEEADKFAKEQIKPLLLVYYIEKEEGLTCTSEQIGAFIEGFYTTQNSDGYYSCLEDMVKECTEYYGADYFQRQVIGAMVSEKIIEYAVKEAV